MTQFPLSLVIKAVDRVTAPMRRINERMKALTKPIRAISNRITAFSHEAGFPRLVGGFTNVGRAVGNVAREVATLGRRITTLGALATFGLGAFLRRSTALGDKLDELSDRTRLGTQWLSEYSYVASRAGVSQDEFNNSLDTFNTNAGMARANRGRLVSFLSAVSPRLLQQLKLTKSNTAAFELMMRAMNRLSDPAKRAAFAQQVFGDENMAAMVKDGLPAIDELRKRFRALAGDQTQFIKQSAAFNDAWDDAALALTGVRNAALTELLPAFTQLANIFKNFLVNNRVAISTWAKDFAKNLPRRLHTLVTWFKRMRVEFGPVVTAIGRVVEALGGVKGVAVALGAIFAGKLILSILSLGGALFTLGGAVLPVLVKGAWLAVLALRGIGLALLTTPVGWFLGAVAGIAAAAYLIYDNWKPIKAFFSDTWDAIVGVFEAGWKKIKPIVDAITLPFRIGGIVGGEIGKLLTGKGDGPPTGAATARRPSLSEMDRRRETRVVVDFENMPRGVRANAAPGGTAPVDLNRGYSMVGP